MRRAFFLLAFFSPAVALADVVVLRDGQELRGVVTEEADTVSVRLDVGTVSFARSEVASVQRESTPIHELEQKRARLEASDVAGRLSLARWAEEHELFESARDLHREVLALRPDDPTARRALGYQKHEGRWMTEEEHLAATGHVRYGGRWVTKEEGERLEREADERREKQKNDERIRELETQVALQEQKIEEIESQPDPQPSSDLLYDGWWPYYGYGALLPHGFLPHQIRRPHHSLRGRLQSHGGKLPIHVGVNAGAKPQSKPQSNPRATTSVSKH